MKVMTFAALAIAPVVAQAECRDSTALGMLALTIYHEARSEGEFGMQLVGEVVMNRVADRRWPDNICDVVMQEWQFTWVKEVENGVIDPYPQEPEAWALSFELAQGLIAGTLPLYDNGAVFYYNPNKADPYWAELDTFEHVIEIGDHIFMTENS